MYITIQFSINHGVTNTSAHSTREKAESYLTMQGYYECGDYWGCMSDNNDDGLTAYLVYVPLFDICLAFSNIPFAQLPSKYINIQKEIGKIDNENY